MSEHESMPVIFRRDNKYYSFVVESHMKQSGKIKFVLFKRNDEQKRIDMAACFVNYRMLRAFLKIMHKMYWMGKDFKNEFISGTDGARWMAIGIMPDQKNKGKKMIGVKIRDSITKESNESYTGDISFQLKLPIDIQEFFDMEQIISSWEMVNINNMFKDGFSGYSSE